MENIEKYSARVNTNELLAYQRDLKKEKELLQNMLTKIDDQIHRLQVEQLHLLGLANKSLKGSEQSDKLISDDEEDPINKSLDLSVAPAFKQYEEEIEDEDDI
ncbi:uncharacterized protein LOC100877721 [Megachile rotundata]|uniref:uncharacterized protein LOC100877721 n=1 Tax=Megachile rotundata TaxID=143995 RepID=UPI000258D6AF|nr:PREDICTED: snRNA-activating protein complex subunit 5-like [Megachile rotundata]